MATQASWQSVQAMFEVSQRVALNRATFLAYILPPFVCQYLMGVLAQLEGTRFYRLAFLLVLVRFAWHATFVDVFGEGSAKRAQMNNAFTAYMCSLLMRSTAWAFARERFRRENHSGKQDESSLESICTAFWNAWDLMFNMRGIGWNWSRGLVLPKAGVGPDSRTSFVLLLIPRVTLNAFAFDACLQTIRMFSPKALGSLSGGSLFGHTLPPLLEFSRAVFVSFLTISMVYFSIQWYYQFFAIIFIILFRQRPSQWPPLFDAPWMSTSLTELWARRWHQILRDQLVQLGMLPFGFLFGRLSGLFGAFLVSGIIHVIELGSFGRGGYAVATFRFWVMNGLGVVLERLWKAATGRRVGGVVGWMWTFGWLALWGVPVVDEWARVGRFGTLSLPGDIEPARGLVEVVRRWLVVSH